MLEGTFKDYLVQTPCHGQGHLSVDQVVQSIVQLDLEHFPWCTTLGNLFQCLTTHTVKNFFLMFSLNLSSFSFKLLPLVQLLQALVRSLSPTLRCMQKWVRKAKVQLKLKFARDVKNYKKSFFRYINNKQKQKENIVPLLNTRGEFVTNNTGKAEVLNNFFTES